MAPQARHAGAPRRTGRPLTYHEVRPRAAQAGLRPLAPARPAPDLAATGRLRRPRSDARPRAPRSAARRRVPGRSGSYRCISFTDPIRWVPREAPTPNANQTLNIAAGSLQIASQPWGDYDLVLS